MEIYISRNGQRYGPFTLSDVQAGVKAGNILPTDLAWHEGMEVWSEVWQIEGITMLEGRVPSTQPPAEQATYYPNISQRSSSSGEFAMLVILSLLIPIAGVVIGIIRASNPEKRSDGMILLGISIVIMISYAIYYSL